LRLGADGRLWILTRSGLTVTDGAFEIGVGRAPTPRVDGISVGGVPMALEARLALPAEPDRVEFEFSAPHPALAERVRMEYRLDGVDRQWRTDTLARRAGYTQLRPGRYVFRVRAWSPDGTQRSDEAALEFRVRASWYQSAWFIALAFLAFGALIFAGAVDLQRRRTRLEAERMRRDFDVVLSERARIARELHDTLLQGFAGITLHLEGVRGKLAQDHPASGTLTDVMGRAEAAIREARAMVWDIRSPGHGEIEVIDALRKVALDALAGRDIALHCVEEGQRRPLTAELEQTLLRVAGEAVVNAARHADPRDVAIVLTYDRTRVMLEVRDDGRGDDLSRFESAAAVGHFGVVGMHERARRAGGTLVVLSAPGKGTIIRLTLPTPRLP
jgi:signal transduction histidine kinase